MNKTLRWTLILTLTATAGLVGCREPEEMPPTGDVHGEMPSGEPMGMEGMGGMEGMQGMDMARHAREADSAATALRQHVADMRDRSADEWYEQMGEHVRQVSGMLRLMDRHMREMDMGMGMDDAQMGEMMGMSAEEHRQMMDGLGALRTDLERLQTAPPEEVREIMPGHLDRLEEMIRVMEGAADHMRGR